MDPVDESAGESTVEARVELAPGYSVARVINGAWQLAHGHRLSGDAEDPPQPIVDQLLRWIDAGFTTFDCADIYTGVEALLGSVLAANARRERPAEIQIHTKLVPDRSALASLDRRYVERVVDRSLARLGVERLDLVQLHWWDYEIPGLNAAAAWLDDLRRAGKIRLLGVTNLDVPRLRSIVEGSAIEIATHQVQYSLLDRRPERGMVELCERHGIRLLAYGSLAGGFLSDPWLGKPLPLAQPSALANRSLVKYQLIIDECGGWPALQTLLEALAAVARRHRASVAQVATRWVLDRRQVAAAIVGTRDAAHLDDRRDLLRLKLDAHDVEHLDAVLADLSIPPGDVYDLERIPGGRHAVIMKTELNAEGREAST